MLNGGLFLYKMYNFKSKFEFYIQNKKNNEISKQFKHIFGVKKVNFIEN